MLGLIGAPIIFASVLAKYFGVYDELSAWSVLGALPIAVWEFSLGVYLTVKGFKPCPITAEMTAAARRPPIPTSPPNPRETRPGPSRARPPSAPSPNPAFDSAIMHGASGIARCCRYAAAARRE